MAPELVLQSYDEKCDIWSVGMLTYQVRNVAFEFHCSTVLKLYASLCHGVARLQEGRSPMLNLDLCVADAVYYCYIVLRSVALGVIHVPFLATRSC